MSRWYCVWEFESGEISVGHSYKSKSELLIYNHARSVHKDRKDALQAAALLLRERQKAYIKRNQENLKRIKRELRGA